MESDEAATQKLTPLLRRRTTSMVGVGLWRSAHTTRASGAPAASRACLMYREAVAGSLQSSLKCPSTTTNANQLQTAALYNAQQYLTLPDWQSGDFPHVDLVNQ